MTEQNCDCISKLEDKGFIERECLYKDYDYQEKGWMIQKFKMGNTGKIAFPTNKYFHINYCPACGKKVVIS
jgi:hypothetical protein